MVGLACSSPGPNPGSPCRRSSGSRRRPRPTWSRHAWRRARSRATSSPTCTGAAAGSRARRSIGSAAHSASRAARSRASSPSSSFDRPTCATSTPRSRRCRRRRTARPASGSRSRSCSRRPAARVAEPWRSTKPSGRATEPVRLHYRCQLCRDQQHRPEHQVVRAQARPTASGRLETSARPEIRSQAARPFPGARRRRGADRRDPRPAHRPPARRPRGDPRPDRGRPPRRAGRVRLAAGLPACRPAGKPPRRRRLGRMPTVRIAGGTIRTAIPERWRERNPWLAFEDGYRQVRAFVQRLEGASLGPLDARFGTDLRSLAEGSPNAVIRVMTPGALEALAGEAREPQRDAGRDSPPGRGDPADPPRPRPAAAAVQPGAARDRIPRDVLGARARGRVAASAGAPARSCDPGAVVVAGRRAAPLAGGRRAAPRARCPGGPAARARRPGGARRCRARRRRRRLPAARRAPVGSRRRGRRSRRADPGRRRAPAGTPDPQQRAAWRPDPGDADLVPAPGLFAPPERFDARPFSPREAAATVLETAIEVLRERGEPARYERLLGEILVGLDRAGQLRRLLASDGPVGGANDATAAPDPPRRARPTEPTDAPSDVAPAADLDPQPPDSAPTSPRRSFDDRPGMLGSVPLATRGRRARHAHPDFAGRPLARPGRAGPRPRGQRARAARPAPHRGDRARSLVARRPQGSRGGRDSARRSGRMGRLQPAVHGRPDRRGRVLRARRLPLLRPRPAGRDARARLPRQLPQPGVDRRAASSPPRTSAAGPPSTRSCWRCSRTAGTGSGCASGSAGATRRAGSATGRSATSSTAREREPWFPTASARAQGGRRGGRLHLVPARRRPPSCSRSNGRRCSGTSSCAATPASRPTSGSSASWPRPGAARARSSQARVVAAAARRAWRRRTGT